MLEGSQTGKKGGFIQMKPTCAAGTVYSESENNCVKAASDGEKPKKKKNKNKNKKHDDDDDDDNWKKKKHKNDDD